MDRRTLVRSTAVAVLVLGAAPGCRQDMHDQPRYEALEASEFFEDGRSARPLVQGTVARGHLRNDEHLYEGQKDGKPAGEFPFPITLEVLRRGRERYDIFCSPCHDRVGTGQGMAVQRGLRRPRSFHEPELRAKPVGYYFDVITGGFGAMSSYAYMVPPRDRWAIIAYVRALQRSQNARREDVPPEVLVQLEAPRR